MTGTQEQLSRDIKQLISESGTDCTMFQDSIQMFLDKGVKQSANFAYCLNFLNGLVYLLSILLTKHEADFQLHLYNLSRGLELLKGPRSIHIQATIRICCSAV